MSFKSSVHGHAYVYRHPGPGTDDIINRQSEAFSQSVAKDLGVDDTFVYEDEHEGWKIWRFIERCEQLDYHNPEHVRQAMSLIRALHDSGGKSRWSFDVMGKARDILELLRRTRTPCSPTTSSSTPPWRRWMRA